VRERPSPIVQVHARCTDPLRSACTWYNKVVTDFMSIKLMQAVQYIRTYMNSHIADIANLEGIAQKLLISAAT